MVRAKTTPVRKRKFGETETVVDRRTKSIVTQILYRKGLVPEKRYFGATVRDSTLTATAATLRSLVDGIDQGTSADTRVGNKIAITRVEIFMMFDRPDQDLAADIPINKVKWVLAVDKQPNEGSINLLIPWAGLPGSMSVYVGSTTNTEGYGVLGVRNPSVAERVRFLKEGVADVGTEMVWNPISTVWQAANQWTKPVHVVKNFAKPLVVQYNQADGTTGVVTNNLGIGFLPGIDEALGVTYNYIVHYTDI